MTEIPQNDDVPRKDSKSQRKRQMLALQELGAKLVNLSVAQLSKIPLEEKLFNAIRSAQSIHQHEAKRRQLQYIGKLMRSTDPAPIEEAIAKIESKNNESKVIFHQIEQWRDQLIQGDDSVIESFLARHPETDRQQLRQLVRNTKKSVKGADTELFRFLRQMMIS